MSLKNGTLFLFLLAFFASFSQEKIDYKADKIKFVQNYKGGAKRLLGHVQFTTKDGMLMTCDSAYFLDNNLIEAYSNIFIRQGDSLTITGKNARYDGNTKLGLIDGNVVCHDNDMTLTTTSLNFDSKNKTANYQTGGTIVSKENTLTSRHGYYFSESKSVSFKYDVLLVNPDYTMTSDTLVYLTAPKTAVFVSPTNIVSKKDKLYCERGWYNTQTQISHLTKKAIIYSEKNILKADSIHYFRKEQTGYGFHHVELIDTAEKMIISGEKSYSNQKTGCMWVTERALLTKIMDKDTLFAVADSMLAFNKNVKVLKKNIQDSVNSIKKDTNLLKEEKNKQIQYLTKDTLNYIIKDSMVLKAYCCVRIYKKDMQGVSDTMIYTAYDSSLTLIHQPILWEKETQLSGIVIRAFLNNKKIDKIYIPENTFIIEQLDTLHYNQIKGKTLWAYFSNDTLRKITVNENVQTAYYLQNSKKKFQGVNLCNSSMLVAKQKAGKLDQILFFKKAKANMLPMKGLNVKDIELEGFLWQGHLKPKSKEDLLKQQGTLLENKK
ncbi:MAG: hypothetical protein JST67_11265 [Bacteroidetes bacterium]|nr:hypothetical protein [Bacteroidota bacterium]